MTFSNSQLSEEEAQELLRSLLHKEGNWIDWGHGCQTLQKAGYSTHDIFESTGFQGSQQNQVIVAAQVYDSLEKAEVSDEVLSYCQQPHSDILYEFRILNQEQRAAAAKLAMDKRLDVDGAHEVARALKSFSRFAKVPEGFNDYPGDSVAYMYWKQAREKKDIQARSRLIAKGLQFATSTTARKEIEKLLTDFTTVPTRKAPLLPVYRLEAEEELSRIVPVAGTMPISRQEVEAVPTITTNHPFGRVQLNQEVAVVPLPGWQAILKAKSPVAIFASSEQLQQSSIQTSEEVLVVVDRGLRDWNENSYFLIEQDNKLEVAWLEEPASVTILGQVVLVLRPKRILDESNITQPWQMDD